MKNKTTDAPLWAFWLTAILTGVLFLPLAVSTNLVSEPRILYLLLPSGLLLFMSILLAVSNRRLQSAHSSLEDQMQKRDSNLDQEIFIRNQIEEKLVCEKQLSDDIINSLAGLFYILDTQGRLTRWNQKFSEVSGYSDKELSLILAIDLFEGEEKKIVSERIQEAFSTGNSYVEANFTSKNGTKIPHYFTGRRTRINGQWYISGLGVDISKRKSAEDALRKRESQLNEAMKLAKLGYWEYDELEDQFTFNEQYYFLHQTTAKEVGGYKISSADFLRRHIYPEDAQKVARRIQEALHSTSPDFSSRIETRILCGDGKIRWIVMQLRVDRSFSKNSAKLIGVSQDITERHRIEQELTSARDAAQVSNRAKSDFISNMSHEVRTPLNGIIGLTQLILEEPISAKIRSYLEKIMISSYSLLGILNDVLDYSKIESGSLYVENRAFDLGETVAILWNLFAQRAQEKNLILEIKILDSVPRRLIGDDVHLRRVLVNLIGNAIKFTGQGHVTVLVDCKEVRQDDAKFVFQVSDTGIGMNNAMLKRLFQPFTQADSSSTRHFEGTGLGLAISRNILRLMGSEFFVDSKPGQGSIFKFEIYFRLDISNMISHSEPPAQPTPCSSCETDATLKSSSQITENIRKVIAEIESLLETNYLIPDELLSQLEGIMPIVQQEEYWKFKNCVENLNYEQARILLQQLVNH
ncbi:hypothetical protein CCP3SC1AL1_1550001 [Gammaproteobacteria bacterium]